MPDIQLKILKKLSRHQWTDAIDLPGTGHSLVALERKRLVEYIDSSLFGYYTPRRFSHKYRLSEAGESFLARQ